MFVGGGWDDGQAKLLVRGACKCSHITSHSVREQKELWSLNMNNATNSSSASVVIDAAECLQDIYPCSLTWSGNLFLLVVYGAILAWGAKQINIGSDKLLEVFPPGLIGGVLLPVLGALAAEGGLFMNGHRRRGHRLQRVER